jgi:LPXTG-motif cell wall-anchored protein
MYGPEGTILGASTTTAAALTLANTGVNSILSVFVGFILVAGAILTLVSINKSTSSK